MSLPQPWPRRMLVLAGALGLIVVVISLRFWLRPSPPPTPVGPLERYFTFTVVAPDLDPIVVERERTLFQSAVTVLRRDPDFFDGWLTIGGVKKAMGDLTGAADIWEYAALIRPSSSLAFNNLGDLYANFLDDYPQAAASYRRAIANSAGEEKQVLFYLSLFDLYAGKLNDPKQALAVLEAGVVANPGSVPLVVLAAQAAAKIGQREPALRYYQAAVKLAPANRELAEEYRRYRAQR